MREEPSNPAETGQPPAAGEVVRYLSHRLTWAYSQEGLSAAESAVLVYLVFASDKDSLECWPALATIAKPTRLGVSTVRRCLRSLEDKGLIASVDRPGTSRRYRLTRPERATPPARSGRPPRPQRAPIR